ncbi:hypothetical protein ACO0K9_00220 [Undibacterium sp. Ji50W]|uniref:hypothetical protein n=1 Tax=Undibacterium sp. Ji50W TaxID=3413041 RepID=UPI003BF36758
MFKGFLFKFILFALLILTCFESITGYTDNRAFKSHGLTAQTEQIDKYSQTVRTKTKYGRTTDVSVTNEADINFTTADNQQITVKKTIPKEIMDKYQRRQPVDIEYVSTDPKKTRWPGETRDVKSSVIFGLICFAVLFFLVKFR